MAKKIDIDFNQAPGARVLVGTLNFKNEGRVPWFGRLKGNTDYPDYKVEFSLGYRNEQLKDGGFSLSDGVPLGFRGVGESADLMRQIVHRVSHEMPIYIFLATDVISDFKETQSVSGSRTVTFGGQEQAKPPVVTYHPAVKNLEFKKSERVEIGTFKFESQAGHHFAHLFADSFNLRSYKDNLPLSDDNAVALSDGKVVVSPFDTSDVDIAVLCDGKVIPNPEPPSEDYSFNLLGEFAPGSKPSNHWFSLYRDPTRADLHLDIVQSQKTHRIHWDQQGHPICRLVKDRIVKANGDLLDQDVLELPPYFIEFDAETPESTVFEIVIGNTGQAGLGWIKANLDLALKFKASVRGSLKFKKGYGIEDSLIPVDKNNIVKEGESPKIILVQVDATTTIQDIIGGRTDGGLIEARLDIEIQDDEGARQKRSPRQRHLVIRAPIGLEKLPHQNWLCIDLEKMVV